MSKVIQIEEGVEIEFRVAMGTRWVSLSGEVAGPVEYREHAVGSPQGFGIYVPVRQVRCAGEPWPDTEVLVDRIDAVRTKEDS